MPDPTPYPWDDRRWPTGMVLLAPLAAIVCPVPVARRLDRVPLAAAYSVHVLGGLLAVLAVFLLTAWANSAPGSGLGGVSGELWLLFAEIYDDLTRDAESLTVGLIATAFFIAFIEAVTLLVAWGMTAWAARVEPFGRSFRRSLARTWLVTPHEVLYIVSFGGLGIALERWRWHTDKEWDQLPWLVRDPEVAIVFTWCALSVLLIVSVLRAFASGGWGAVCLWPPQCEGCGYSLQGLARDAGCPECGRALDASTTNSPRQRTLHRPGRPVTLHDWFWASSRALVQPTALGRELRVLSPTRGRAVYLLIDLLLIAAVNAVGFTLLWLMMMLDRGRHFSSGLDDFILSGLMTLSITTLIAWMIMLASASVVGTSARLGTKRNLLPLAMQGTLCLGWLLAIWAAIGWAVLLGFFVLFELIDLRPYRAWGIDEEVFYLFTVFGLPILLLLSYLYWLGKITWAGRNANQ